MKGFLRRSALIGLTALGMASPVLADPSSIQGLGQAWPNAKDVSRNPAWHVYVFPMHGVRFFQVTDLAGHIVGALGTANSQYITLPIGQDAQYVSTPQQPAALPSGVVTTAPATVVYQDATTQLSVAPMSNGATALLACGNPTECNTNGP